MPAAAAITQVVVVAGPVNNSMTSPMAFGVYLA